ncbi:MAG: cytochrome C [Candidatus Sumerlaeia bacterium]|nr:cytochrome C [Candidatus Sumerlaeia bacterium]
MNSPLTRFSLLLAITLLALALQGPARANTQITLGASCVTGECHGDVTAHQFLHGPVNLKQCQPCHEPIGGRHEFAPLTDSRSLCITCHEVDQPKAFVHGPFQTDCVVCHSPHGDSNRHFVKGGEGAASCTMCHDSVTRGMTHLHGPVAVGECLVCHEPHQSNHKGLLIDARPQLCMGCHIDVAHEIERAVVVHQPVEMECAGCHNPHGGTAAFFHPAEGPDLCRSCHGGFLEEAMQAPFPHGAMTEGKACQNCHAPHASAQQGLLGTDTMDLCLSCHSSEIRHARGTIPNIAAQLSSATFLHGPISERNCVACHKAHGSDVASILTKPFPREFYAPYKEGAYDMCFECHDNTLVLNERSTATQFRDGDRNLHFLHVNREKGRTCRACHSEHASVQPHHVRTEVPFGRWMMKVQFTKTETGGTCETGCHIPYGYDRVRPAAGSTTP